MRQAACHSGQWAMLETISTCRRTLVVGWVCAAASLTATSCSLGRDCPPPASAEDTGPGGYALQFCGTGADDVDRVKVPIDDPATDDPGPPVDVGAEDFTIEWWMRAERSDNTAGPVECGSGNYNWIYGNIIIDRDRYLQDRKFGVSLA